MIRSRFFILFAVAVLFLFSAGLPPLEKEDVGPGPVGPDLQRQLRALGYVEGK